MQSIDGTVAREYVIRILAENGVSVLPQKGSKNGELVFAKGSVLEVRTLPNPVSRRTVHYLSRKFETAIHLFYS
jgi:hypothetical protein